MPRQTTNQQATRFTQPKPSQTPVSISTVNLKFSYSIKRPKYWKMQGQRTNLNALHGRMKKAKENIRQYVIEVHW